MLNDATIRQTRLLLSRRQLSITELLQHTEKQIQTWEPLVEAFLYLDESVFRAGQQGETNVAKRGTPGASDSVECTSLLGVPIAIKDLFDVQGMPTTGGSAAYHFVPDADAEAVKRLRQQGAIMVGKTNTQELAFGVVTEPTKNPWNLQHIPGGSSGGSAAAVATKMSFAALGTDTGGSVRIPAACCGVVGFKPTVGLISKHGVMPLSTTLDHVGVLTRFVSDAKDLFAVLRGFDARDPSCVVPPMLRKPLPTSKRLGIPWSYFEGLASPPVLQAFKQSVALFESLGFQTTAVEFPAWEEWRSLQLTIRLPEAYEYHRNVLEGEKRSLLRGDLAERLDGGNQISALEYVMAQQKRNKWIYEWRERMQGLDALLLPTLLTTAPKTGESVIPLGRRSLPIWEALTYLTAPMNVLGFPAVSLPNGYDSAGLPIGLQLVGFPYEDDFLLALAQTYEEATVGATAGFRSPKPPVKTKKE